MGGWRFGNTIDGAQAEYLLVPNAIANLALIPDHLTDEEVLMCPDIMSTGFSGAESGKVKIGDTVAVFAQGPIGLCATAGAKLSGASLIITVDSHEIRLKMSRQVGADVTINFKEKDLDAFSAGLGDQTLITTLCPGGKERMRRLMTVLSTKRPDLKPMVTHRFKLNQILEAYDIFSNQRDGVLKVAIAP